MSHDDTRRARVEIAQLGGGDEAADPRIGGHDHVGQIARVSDDLDRRVDGRDGFGERTQIPGQVLADGEYVRFAGHLTRLEPIHVDADRERVHALGNETAALDRVVPLRGPKADDGGGRSQGPRQQLLSRA